MEAVTGDPRHERGAEPCPRVSGAASPRRSGLRCELPDETTSMAHDARNLMLMTGADDQASGSRPGAHCSLPGHTPGGARRESRNSPAEAWTEQRWNAAASSQHGGSPHIHSGSGHLCVAQPMQRELDELRGTMAGIANEVSAVKSAVLYSQFQVASAAAASQHAKGQHSERI